MADIFISYASQDRDRIVSIVDALEEAGWTVFWDRKTPVGMSWEKHIEWNLRQAACVVVVWSEVSINKDWVKIEARNGLGRGCLAPVRIDPVTPPFGFDHVQFADLNGWTGDTANVEWRELITAVDRLAPRPALIEPPPGPTAPNRQGTPPMDLSAYWQRLLKNPRASELQQLADEVQALREAHPTNPELIKLQRRIADAAEPQATQPRVAAPSRKWTWAVAAVLVLGVAGVTMNQYLQPPSPRAVPAREPTGQSAAPEPVNKTPLGVTKTEPAPRPAPAATSTFPLPDLVAIPAGCFTMGSPMDEVGVTSAEIPQHKVCLEGFRMGRHEVTFDQYDAFARDTGHKSPDDKSWGRGNRPVINMRREDAQAFTEWLSVQLESQCDLPSEAQWEYAARAGTTKGYAVPAPQGSDNIAGKALANCDGCGSQWDKKKTAPIGSFESNAWGLYDMHGNVWEWVQDCWHGSYQNAPADGKAWNAENSGECTRGVLRGGSLGHIPEYARSAYRLGPSPDRRHVSVGFRVSCSSP